MFSQKLTRVSSSFSCKIICFLKLSLLTFEEKITRGSSLMSTRNNNFKTQKAHE